MEMSSDTFPIARSPHLTPYGLLFLKIGGSLPPPKTAIAIISGTGKATNYKFGWYIHRVHRNKNPLKILEKRPEHGHIDGLSKFFEYTLFPQVRVKLYELQIV